MKKIIAIMLFALQSVFLVSSDESKNNEPKKAAQNNPNNQLTDPQIAAEASLLLSDLFKGLEEFFIDSSRITINEQSSDEQSFDIGANTTYNALAAQGQGNPSLQDILKDLIDGGHVIGSSRITLSDKVLSNKKETNNTKNHLGSKPNNQQAVDDVEARQAGLVAFTKNQAKSTDKPMNLNDDDQQPVGNRSNEQKDNSQQSRTENSYDSCRCVIA